MASDGHHMSVVLNGVDGHLRFHGFGFVNFNQDVDVGSVFVLLIPEGLKTIEQHKAFPPTLRGKTKVPSEQKKFWVSGGLAAPISSRQIDGKP